MTRALLLLLLLGTATPEAEGGREESKEGGEEIHSGGSTGMPGWKSPNRFWEYQQGGPRKTCYPPDSEVRMYW